MIESKLKIFKLNSSGTLDEVPEIAALDFFKLTNVLVIYALKKKIIYTWIGKNVGLRLKNYIPKLRELFLRDFPDYRVLRNITVESGSESSEFFRVMGFTEKQLKEQIEKRDSTAQVVHLKNEQLKIKPNNHLIISDSENIIKSDQEIIKETKKIEDISFKQEQEEILTKELEKDVIDKIEIEPISIKEKFKKEQEIDMAIKIKDDYIKKEQKLKEVTEIDKKKVEVDRFGEIITNITSLYKESQEALNQGNFHDVLKKHKEISELIEKFILLS